MTEYERYMRSEEWAETANLIRKLRGWLCEDCYDRGILTKGWEIHHAVYLGVLYHERDFLYDTRVLRLLCSDCHRSLHPDKQDYE